MAVINVLTTYKASYKIYIWLFNDVLFVSRNTASLVERSTVNTNDILVLGERIHDSLVVCE